MQIAAPVRSVGAVIVGLILITAIVEPIEFALVALVHGGPTTDQEVYSAIRNQTWFLVTKLAYNTGAAVVAGYVTARMGGRSPLSDGAGLAVAQTAAFGLGLLSPEIRRTTPDWMWAALIAATIAGILFGAALRRRVVALIVLDSCPR